MASKPPEPTDFGPICIQRHLDDVDTGRRWIESRTEPAQLSLLLVIDCVAAQPAGSSGHGLDLEHDWTTLQPTDDIDLATPNHDVPTGNHHAMLNKELRRDALTECTDPAAAR